MEKPFDAALIHSYWLSEENNQVKLSYRSQLTTFAGALAYLQGEVQTLVTTTGQVWGPKYPSVAELVKEALVNRFDVPEQAIVALPQALSTAQEVQIFIAQAREQRWSRLMSLASWAHFLTIPQLYNPDITYRPAEIYLLADPRTRQKALEFILSRYQLGHLFYEGGKAVAQLLGLEQFLADQANQRNDKRPVFVGDRIGLPMDRYNL